MTHWQRDVPGSFEHRDPEPTWCDRAVEPGALGGLLAVIILGGVLMFAGIIYGPRWGF